MKKLLNILLFMVLILTALLPVQPAIASNATTREHAEYIGTVRITNNGTTASDVFTVFNLTTQDLIDGDFCWGNLTNSSLLTNGGDDTAYMPAPGATNAWCVYVPSIIQSGILDYKLYIGGGQDMDGDIRYFPAISGMSTLDEGTLEPGANNWTIEQRGFFNTTAGSNMTLVSKDDAPLTYVSDTDEVTSEIYGTEVTVTQDAGVNVLQLRNGAFWRVGQRIDDFNGRIKSVKFHLFRTGAPTGTGYARVRDVTTDALIGTLGSIDVSTINNGAFQQYTFDTNEVLVYPAKDIRVAFEWGEGEGAPADRVEIHINGADTVVGELTTVQTPGLPWADQPVSDCRFVLVYLPIEAQVTAPVTPGDQVIKVEQINNSSGNWLAGWDNRIQIDIDADKIDANLTHFPVLIKLSSSSGIGADDVTAVFDELGANHLKLAITEDDGTTEMYVEVEKWDNGAEEAWLWTSLAGWTIDSATDTTIYLYFDNDHADNVARVGVPNDAIVHNVWDGNFVLVDHMQDDPNNASTRDSTSFGYDGTKTGANQPIETPSGKVGDAQLWDGSNYFIDHGNQAEFNIGDGGSYTFEGIFKSSLADFQTIFNKCAVGPTTDPGYVFRLHSDGKLYLQYGDGVDDGVASSTNDNFDDGAFHHFLIAKDGDTAIRIVIDGVAETVVYTGDALNTIDDMSNAASLYVGKNSAGFNYPFVGTLDSIRMSDNIARSASWAKAAYNTNWDTLVDYIPNGDGYLVDYAFDFKIYVGGELKNRTLGLTVPPNPNDWDFLLNGSMPYLEYQKITVNGVLQSWYQPDYYLDGTIIPDRSYYGTSFYGAADYITYGNTASINSAIDAGSFTMSIWMRSTTLPATDYELLSMYAVAPRFKNYINAAGEVYWYIDDGAGTTVLSGIAGTDVLDGNWHLINLVRDATNAKIHVYVDDTLSAEAAFAAVDMTNGNNLDIARGASHADYNGDTDQFVLYARALGQSEIIANFNSGVGSYEVYDDTDLIILSRMEEGTGLTTTDDSGNGNTGTLTAGPLWINGVVPRPAGISGTNDATPTFRTTTSDTDVTAELIAFVPASSASASNWTISAPEDMIGPVVEPSELFNETVDTGMPGIPFVEDVMNNAGVPSIMFYVPLVMLILCIIGLVVGKFSLLAQLIIMTMIIFAAAGVGIPAWIGLIFLLDGLAFVLASKQFGW